MATTTDFTKLVPGFDFLQGLMKNAGATIPAMGQWIAPTLDPDELDKRIEQLKAVQFWLEQNSRMLAATVQALEVQRMTLSTLKTMNLPMADLRDKLKVEVPAAAAFAPAPATDPKPARKRTPRRTKAAAGAAPAGGASPIDPLQWWGALTKQFADLAGSAMKDGAADAARQVAGAARQGLDAAGAVVKKAARRR